MLFLQLVVYFKCTWVGMCYQYRRVAFLHTSKTAIHVLICNSSFGVVWSAATNEFPGQNVLMFMSTLCCKKYFCPHAEDICLPRSTTPSEIHRLIKTKSYSIDSGFHQAIQSKHSNHFFFNMQHCSFSTF